MKQIGLFLFFILNPFVSFVLQAGVTQASDSLEVFRNITDIEKRIQQNTPQPDPEQVVVTRFLEDSVAVAKDTVRSRSFVRVSIVPLDSAYRRKANGTLLLPELSYGSESLAGLTFRDTIFYNPLFLPMIFTGKMLPYNLSFYPFKIGKGGEKDVLLPREKSFAPNLAHAEFVNRMRRYFYRNYPDRVKFSVLHFDSLPANASDKEVVDNFNPLKELISVETNYSFEAPQIDGVAIGRKYWSKNGEHLFQLSQSYFSPNWHKGGISNFNIVNNHIVRLNYQKEKIRFNNTLEWRLSVFTAPDDTMRKFRIADDMIRYFGDFGIDAFVKKWSYAANLEAKSQIFNNYPSNSRKIRSAFLAPLYVKGGIGLKYNLDKKSQKTRHRRTRLNLHLNPMGFGLRYVDNSKVEETRYGIEKGKKHKVDLGSTLTALLIYDFNKYISWHSRFMYFSSYHKVEAELENRLSMAITNAFSTSFFVFLRYDDAVPPDPKFKYLQLTQMLSFGLNYKW